MTGLTSSAILLLALAIARPLAADAGSTPRVAGRIHVLRLDVFEPEQLGALRPLGELANTLHVTTREGVVRDLLIIEEGDAVTEETLREAERTLRRSGLFRTADVVAYGDGDTVDVVVTTRDLWSTQVVLSYSTAGGDREVTAGGIESNFLGHGDIVSGVYRFSDQADRASGRFTKRRFLGSQSLASVAYAEGEDGVFREASASQPYYSVVAPWSGAIHASGFRGKVWLYEGGEKSGRYRVDSDLVYGHASLYEGGAGRWQIGLGAILDDRVSAPLAGDAFTIGPLRTDRRRQITVAFGHLSRHHVQLRNVDRAGQPEDHALGHNTSLALGMELAALGSTRDRPYAAATTVHSARLGRGIYGSLRLRAAAHVADGELDGHELVAVGKLIGQRWRSRTQAVRVLVNWGEGFSSEELLYVGARSGLRGFPFRAFRGDRAVMANVEERIETGLSPLGLAFGLVAFGDAGFVWARPARARFRDIRSDVGLGVRLAAPFSPLPFRVDVARGLGHDGDWEISVSAGQLFRLTRALDFSAPLPGRFGSSLE